MLCEHVHPALYYKNFSTLLLSYFSTLSLWLNSIVTDEEEIFMAILLSDCCKDQIRESLADKEVIKWLTDKEQIIESLIKSRWC